MHGWQTVKLKEVCERVTVGYVGPMAHEYRETGVPFLRSQNITPFRLDFQNLKYIDDKFHERIKKSALRPGDVGIVRTGYPGTACVIPRELPLANCSDLVIVRPGKDLNPHFLCAIFNSTFGRDMVGGNLVGAAQQHFNVTVAKELKLQLPPRKVQDKIAAILSAYDDLIANNRRRIALLEKMAEEIYREWFVHLRFPGHEQAKLEKGLPVGWSLKPFSELVTINPGEPFDKTEFRPFVGMEDLSLTSMFFRSKEERRGSAGAKFRNNDVLFPRITPSLENGKRGFVLTLKEDQVGLGSTEFIVFRERVLSAEHIYLLSCSSDFRKHAELSMSGASGRQRVAEDCFTFFLVKVPPEPLRRQFSATVRPLFDQIGTLAGQLELVTQTRDALLPRLISGKLPVDALDIHFPSSMQLE